MGLPFKILKLSGSDFIVRGDLESAGIDQDGVWSGLELIGISGLAFGWLCLFWVGFGFILSPVECLEKRYSRLLCCSEIPRIRWWALRFLFVDWCDLSWFCVTSFGGLSQLSYGSPLCDLPGWQSGRGSFCMTGLVFGWPLFTLVG